MYRNQCLPTPTGLPPVRLLVCVLVLLGTGGRLWSASTNDNFANAVALGPGLPSNPSVAINSNTVEPGEPSVGETGTYSAWWKWTPAVSQKAAISTRDTLFDTVLSVYTGSTLSTLTEIAKNDDYYDGEFLGGNLYGSGTSYVTIDAVAGTTYYIRANAYGAVGTGNLRVSLYTVPTITITPPATQPAEPSAAQSFTVTLSSAVKDKVKVHLEVTGTATAGSDYTTIVTDVVIPENTASVSVTVAPLDDGAWEGPESVVVSVKPASATGTAWGVVSPVNSYALPTLVVQATTAITDNEGSIIYVDAVAGGANNGTSWTNAYTSLVTALAAAGANTEVWVKAGTYKPNATRASSFVIPASVRLYGGFAGGETSVSQRNWQKNPTTLSGDIGTGGNPADNCYHVVRLSTGSRLDGFTVRDGNANGGSYPDYWGGGVLAQSVTPEGMSNCVITANLATYGAGIYNDNTGGYPIENLVLVANTTTNWGGGAYDYQCTGPVAWRNCVFANNSGSSSSYNAAGVFVESSPSTFTNCTFSGNFSSAATPPSGGAIVFWGASATGTVTNSILYGNLPSTPSTQIALVSGTCSVSYSVTQFVLGGGGTNTSNNTTTNPSFINTASVAGVDGIFATPDDGLSVLASSVAVNGGTSTGAPAVDVAGQPRPMGAFYDRGAYEKFYSGTNAGVIFVDATATGANNGTTWTNAYRELRDALAASVSGDQIWVAKGAYKPTAGLDRNASLVIKSGVTVYGGFAGGETNVALRNPVANQTALSGDIGASGDPGDNSHHVVSTATGGTLHGLVLTGGNCNGSYPANTGGGIYISAGSLTLYNCRVTGNVGNYGTAVFVDSSTAALYAYQSVFDGNAATSNGGCMYVYNTGTGYFSNCVITGNSAGSDGGAFYVASGSLTLVDSTVRGNTTPATGGAIYSGGGSVSIYESIIYENSSGLAGSVTPTVYYSDVQSYAGGTGNISASPQFVNVAQPAGPDGKYFTSDDGLKLLPTSPCVNTGAGYSGVDILGNSRPYGGGYDMGAYEGRTPTIQFASGTGSGNEETASQNLSVTLSGVTDFGSTVTYQVTGGTATGNGVDHLLASGTLNFAAGSSASQNILLTLVNDSIDEDPETVVVTLLSATNAALGSTKIHTFTINDPVDTAGITYAPASGLITTEGGGTAVFTVALNSQPTGTVAIDLVSSNIFEGTVSPASLAFTPSTWNVAQNVTLTGVQDFVDDGNVSYSISDSINGSTTDPKYLPVAGVTGDVLATNQDDDTAAFVIIPTSGLVVPESSGTATFVVRLATQPTVDVTLDLSSSNPSAGTVSPTTLSFTIAAGANNWNADHVVTVTGTPDDLIDGNITFQIVTAPAVAVGEINYNNLNPTDVTCISADDEVAGVILSTTAIAAAEGGGPATYSLKLASQPAGTNTVTVRVFSPDEQCTVDTNLVAAGDQDSLVFTSSDWNGFKSVRVTAPLDQRVEGPHVGVIAHVIDTSAVGSESTYPSYLTVGGVTVSITDGDTAGVTIAQSAGSTAVSELTPLVADAYTVQLNTEPSTPIQLLTDIAPGIQSTYYAGGDPGKGVIFGANYYFSAYTPTTGRELWRSMGTPASTVLVKDIWPGTNWSSPSSFVALTDRVLFVANDGYNGSELWMSDGTSGGTTLVRDIRPGASGSTISNLVVQGGIAYFFANDGSSGQELWRSDGTWLGTYLVKDLYVGSTSGASTSAGLVSTGSRLFFRGSALGTGQELACSDGTTAGTTIIDIAAGLTGSNPVSCTAVGSVVYFSATVAASGVELWRSDGTPVGTTLVKDIRAGVVSSSPTALTAGLGGLYFTANDGTNGTELWKSDGTAVNTVLVKDIFVGASASSPFSLVNCGSYLAFVANDGVNGYELWATDGTAGGTTLLADTYPGSGSGSLGSLVFSGTYLIFSAYDGTAGQELWRSNGTPVGTQLVIDALPGVNGSYPGNLYPTGSDVILSLNAGLGTELYTTDGLSLTLVSDIDPASTVSVYSGSPYAVTVFDEKFWFTAYTPAEGSELWVSDGSVGGTTRLTDSFPGSEGGYPSKVGGLGSLVLFGAADGSYDRELWISDGTSSGTSQLLDLWGGGSSSPDQFVSLPGVVIFTATDAFGSELWRSDGTVPGTYRLSDINGTGDSWPSYLTVVDDTWVYFTAYDPTSGTELYWTDGTVVSLVSDLNPGSGGSNPYALTSFRGGLLCTAYDWITGNNKAYFTTGGSLSASMIAGPDWPQAFLAVGTTAYFQAYEASSGSELWSTDGTSATLVKDIDPGTNSSNPQQFVVLGSQVIFSAYTSAGGQELWQSDGTPGGTTLIKDAIPGSGGSNPQYVTELGGFAYFYANDPVSGYELWRTDGTAVGTRLIQDLNPGVASSDSGNGLFSNGSVLFWSATDGANGYEPWIAAPGQVTISVTPDSQELVDTDGSLGGNQTTPLIFTVADYALPQTVSVFAVDDLLYEDNPHTGVIAHVTASAGLTGDPNYDTGSVTVPSVTVSITDNDPIPTVTFSASSQNRNENVGAFTITVTQSAASSKSTTIPFTVSGTALASGTDYTLSTSSPLTIPAGSTTATINLSIVDDGLDENSETIQISLGTPTYALLGATPVHTVTILDDDPLPTVSFTAGTSNPGEAAGTQVITAQLSVLSGRNVTVPFTLGGTATQGGGADYTITSTPITITAGSMTASITITLNNDLLDEDDETVIVTMGSPTFATASGVTVHTATIADNDATPTVTFSSPSQSGAENVGSLTVTASLSAPSGRTVTMPYSINGLSTATGGGTDYSTAPASLSFSPGTTSQNITISVASDALDEDDETVIIDMETPTFATKGATQAHTATILDDDALPSVQFTSTSQTNGEGVASVTITAQLFVPSGRTVTVPFTLGGIATIGAGNDYISTPSPLSFPAGTTLRTITLTVDDDLLDEDDETVVATLSTPTFATLGTNAVHTATITDNDALPTVDFALASQSVTEPNASTLAVTVMVNLSGASGRTVTVPFVLGGTALGSGVDYTPGSSPLTFAPGITSQNLTLTVASDLLDEDDETITVAFGTFVYAAAGTITGHTVTIQDDANDLPPTVTFTTGLQSVSENAGTATMTVQLSAVSGRQVQVPFSPTGTATIGGGNDYTISATPATIAAGSTSATITVTIGNDLLDEDDETVTATMGTLVNATAGTTTAHTLTITDNDATPTVAFTASTQSVGEGVGTVTVTAQVSPVSGRNVTVPFTFGGSAVSPADYSSTASPLIITAGSPSAAITLTIVDDGSDEIDETVVVTMGSPTYAGLGATTQQTVTITDNDALPTVSFALGTSGSLEGAGAQVITVQVSPASGKTVTIPFTLGGGALSPADYGITASPLVIAPGNASATITLTPVDDIIDELSEDAVLTLGSVTNGTASGTTVHTFTITDNDDTPTVQWTTPTTASIAESGTLVVTAQLSAASGLAIDVPFTLTGSTASGSDYAITASPLAIAAGSTTVTATITITADSIDEGDETVLLTIGTPTNAGQGSTLLHTATITDDDTAGLVLVQSGGSTAVAELVGSGTSDTYTVALATEPTATVTISLSVLGADVTRDQATLTFLTTDWFTPQTVTVTAVDDLIPEGGHSDTVQHSSSSTPGDAYHTLSAVDLVCQVADNDQEDLVITADTGGTGGATEGGATYEYTIRPTTLPGGTITVTMSGLAGEVTLSPAFVTFDSGDYLTAKTITVTAVNDGFDEISPQTITLVHTCSNPGNGYDGIVKNLTVDVYDNDAPPVVSINSVSVAEGNAGPATLAFTVSLGAASDQTVTVDWTTGGGTASAGVDYVAASGTVTFVPGDTSEAVNATVTGDTLDEDNETVQVTLSNLGLCTAGTVLGVGTITDDDTPPTLQFTSSGQTSGVESGDFTATVLLSTVSGRDVTVNFSVNGTDTAEAGDYSLTGSPVIIPAGSTSVGLTFTVQDDAVREDDETVIVDLGAPGNATVSGTASHTLTITDDEADPTVAWTLPGQTKLEDTETAVVTLQLSAASEQTVTVPLAYTGTANDPADYSTDVATATFNPGDTSVLVTITPVADGTDEDDESVILTINGPTNATVGGTDIHTVTITDDDASPTVALSPATVSVSEGAGTTPVTATLSALSGRAVTVNYTVAGTATLGDDVTLSPGVISIPAGSLSADLTVTLIDDTLSESSENILISLGALVNATPHATAISSNITITDNESLPQVEFATALTTYDEADGTVVIMVTQSATSATDTTVTYSVGGSATVTTDYALAPASITIPAGSTTGSLSLTIVDDLLDENNETVAVTLTGTSANAQLLGAGTLGFTGTITDNDDPPTLAWQISSQDAAEDGTAVTVTAELSAASGLTVASTIGVGGTSVGADRTLSGTSLSFAPGETTKSITVTVVDDVLDEDDESVVLTLGAPSNGTLGAQTVHVVTILDDNTPPNVAFSAATSAGTENGSAVTVNVALTAISGRDVVVPYVIGGSAGNGVDFALAPASPVTIPAGTTSVTLTFTLNGIYDDLLAEGDETATLTIGVPANAGVGGVNLHTLTIADNESALTVDFSAAAQSVNEGDGVILVTADLTSPSAVDVTIPFTLTANLSGPLFTAVEPDDVSVDPSPLVIPAGSTSASIAIAVVQDPVAEKDETVIVTMGAVINANKGTVDVHTVTILDDDPAGLTLVEFGGSTDVTEGGGTDSYTVVLNHRPGSNVTVTFDAGVEKVTANPTSLTFTDSNWDTPQPVSIAAFDDALVEGAHIWVVNHLVSGDPVYTGAPAVTVTVNITDNDVIDLVTDTGGSLSVDEAGGNDTYTVALASKPEGSVTITLSPNGQQTVSPTTLNFTDGTWNIPQTVTVTAVDDAVDEASPHAGSIAYSAVGAGIYPGQPLTSTAVSVLDNDVAGVTVLPATGLSTTEAGGVAIFVIMLDTQPTATVTIDLSVPDTSEGSLSVSSVVFTPTSWLPKIVFVTGENDDVDDGDVGYTVVASDCVVSAGVDANYAGRPVADVSLTNIDNDTAGVTVIPPGSDTLDEADIGTTFTYSVTLTSEPTGTVTITPVSDGQTLVTPPSISFTSTDWSQIKDFTVAPVDDQVDEASPHTAIVSHNVIGAGFGGVLANNISASILDDDDREVLVAPLAGLVVDEIGTTDTFAIVLATKPLTNVSITLLSGDSTEGSVSPAVLTFTPVNWLDSQSVIVRGIDDDLQDGPQPWLVLSGSSSSDANYGGLAVSDVAVTTNDDDTAFVTVSTPAVTVAESGTTAVFTIVLDSEPTVDVRIDLQSTDEGEATVSPASITFSPSNWDLPRNVTVTGVNDDVEDGDQYPVIEILAPISGDPNYSVLDPTDVTVTNTDNDGRGVTIAHLGGFTQVTEGGSTDSYSVALESEPTGTVTITIAADGQSTVVPLTLDFDASNWFTPQPVVVTAFNDLIAEGPHTSTISHSASGADYAGFSGIEDVVADVVDNDSAFIVATPSSGLTTTEAAGTATFTIKLNSQPTGTTAVVKVDLSSTNLGAGTVSPATVSFDDTNWSDPVTITVTGVDDSPDAVNAPVPYQVWLNVDGPGTDDPTYAALDGSPAVVTLQNLDDDTATILLSLTPPGSYTTEGLGTATLSVVLSSQPTQPVSITLAALVGGEITVPGTALAFDGTDWNLAQTLTLTGINDDLADGDQTVTVRATALAPGEANFNGITADIGVVNQDNDTPFINVTPTSGLTTTEVGGTASFDVVLNSKPAGGASVQIPVSSSLPGQGAPSTVLLTFLDTTWDTPQTVTVTGADGNSTHDGNVPYTIILGQATSGDADYQDFDASDVSLMNLAVNNQPTLDVLTDLNLLEGAGATLVNLTGIGTGQAGENQVLAITATSSLTSVAPDPTISYTSPLPSGTITVTPAADAFGTTTVTVTVTDDASLGSAASARIRTFDVVIQPVNDAPAFTKGADVSVAEDSGAQTINGWATAISTGPANESAQTLGFTCTAVNPALFSVQPTLDVTGNLTFTPADDVSGSTTVNVVLADDGGTANGGVDQVSQSFLLAITSVNDDPVFDLIGDVVVGEDAPTQQVTITGIGPGVNEAGQILSFVAVSSNPGLIPTPGVTYIQGATTAIVDFTPVANASGLSDITITVTDNGTVPEGGTKSFSDIFRITVNAVNDPPLVITNTGITVVLKGDAAIDEVGPSVVRLEATDVDSPVANLFYTLTLPPGQGLLYLDTGSTAGAHDVGDTDLGITDTFTQPDLLAGLIRYVHGGSGSSDGFAFTVSDGSATGGLNVFQITIDRQRPDLVLDPGGDGDLTYTENGPPETPIYIAALGTVEDFDSPDFDGGVLTIDFASGGSPDDVLYFVPTTEIDISLGDVQYLATTFGTLISGGDPGEDLVVSLNANATAAIVQTFLRAVTYVNGSDTPGATTRVVRASMTDGDGDTSADVTRNILVVPVNDPPMVADLALVTPENVGLTAGIIATDADGDTLTYTVPPTGSGGPTKGSASVAVDGTLTYTPLVGQSGNDAFSVIVSDGNGGSDTATITVVITGNNDVRPWVTSDPPMEAQDGDIVTYDIAVDASDVTLTPTLSFVLIGTLPPGTAYGFSPPTATGTTLTMDLPDGADPGYVSFVIQVTETSTTSASVQPVLIRVLTGGTGGG